MDRLFLDANVLFTAAHNPNGKAAFLFEHAARADARWTLLSSAHALEEARRNLARKASAALAAFERQRASMTLVPQPAKPALPIGLPAKDQPIWAAALAARSTHLLTGDLQHFGPLMNRRDETAGVLIQTVAAYLASW